MYSSISFCKGKKEKQCEVLKIDLQEYKGTLWKTMIGSQGEKQLSFVNLNS